MFLFNGVVFAVPKFHMDDDSYVPPCKGKQQ